MLDRFTPANVLQMVERHYTAVADVCADVAAINNGEELYAALAFSAVFSSLTPRHNLSPINSKHHYDLYCQKFISHLPRLSNQIGYKPMIPLGTIGKMLNYLLHRDAFIRKCLDEKDHSDVTLAILDEFSDYRINKQRSLTSTEIAEYLGDALKSLHSSGLRQRVSEFIELLKSGAIKGPGNCYSRDEITLSLDAKPLIDFLIDAMRADKLKRYSRYDRHRQVRLQNEDHIEFEALMDALNMSLPMRLNQSSENKRILFFGSAQKRTIYGQSAGDYSRAMLSLFYWQSELARAI